MSRCDFYDLLSKSNMHRVDTTRAVYSKKLADLTNEVSRALRKAQDESAWVAAISAEHRDILNDKNFYVGNSDPWTQARSISYEIEAGLRRMSDLKSGLESSQEQIASTKESLDWITEGRAEAEVSGINEGPIDVD